MVATRKSPTQAVDTTIAGDDYGDRVNVEITSLWNYITMPLTGLAGTANAITASSLVPLIASPVVGNRISFIPTATNTGAATIDVDAKGVKAIVTAANVALVGDEIRLNQEVWCEYDGTSWRIIGRAALGIAADVQFSALSTDRTGNDSATAQIVFNASQDTFTAEALTSYIFEALYIITRAAGTTAHTTGVLFAGAATFSSIGYIAICSNPTGNVLSAASEITATVATETVVTASNNSATENLRIRIKGIMRVNGAGTIIPQIKYSAAPGGAPTIKAQTYFLMQRIGSNTVLAAGTWA